MLLRSGAFGASLGKGGDGTAEARYVESMEYYTRQYMRGADWAWEMHHPDLLIDYFPLADEVDHAFYGYYDTRWPGYTERGRENAAFVRERAWTLVDI